MEVVSRLENIEFHIRQLKKKCELLEEKNKDLAQANKKIKEELATKNEKLLNLEETNKISKLAQSASQSIDNTAFKNHIEQIISEIDKCLSLVKQ